MNLSEYRLPTIPRANLLRVPWGYTSNDVNSMAGNSLPIKAAHINDLLGSELRISTFRKSDSPLMAGIFCQGNPLKIFRKVIQFVAINMIDGKPRLMAWTKSKGDKPVKSFLDSLSTGNLTSNFKVSIPRFTWGKDSAFSLLRSGMCYPKSCSSVGAFLPFHENSRMAGNVPFNALRLYNAPFFTGARNGFEFG